NPRPLHLAQAMRGREHDAAFSITLVDLCHRRVTINRAFCQRRERSQDSLRLPKRVGKKDAVAAASRIFLPPIENLSSQVRVAMPSIPWRAKCGFGHKHITWHWLKWVTGGIRFSFIIAGDDPDFSVPFHAYLGRSQNMSGGMEGNLHAAKLDFFPVIDAMHSNVLSESCPQYTNTRLRAVVLLTAAPRMITVRMCDHGALGCAHRINVEVPGRTIQSLFRHYQHSGCDHTPRFQRIPTQQNRRSPGQGAKKLFDPQRPEKPWVPAGASGHELSRPKRVSWLPASGMMSAMSIPVSCVGVK